MEDHVIDVSDFFWGFVSDVVTLSYARLVTTPGFEALTATGHAGFGLHCTQLGRNPSDAGLIMDDGDVYLDGRKHRLVFKDVTSLMHNSLRIVSDPVKRHTLESCLAKITSFVDTLALATELEHLPLPSIF